MHCISVFCAPSEGSVIQNHGKMIAPPASTYNAHTIEHAIAYSLLLQAAPTSTTLFAFTKSCYYASFNVNFPSYFSILSNRLDYGE
uniref:Uncharacterized protein n=1 Tax=Glossina palpalis gambiensis TaxID=67801 RepID=A0A1B0AY89_9MUSC